MEVCIFTGVGLIENVWTTIPIAFEQDAFVAVECIRDAWPAADDAFLGSLAGSALVADVCDDRWVYERVTQRASMVDDKLRMLRSLTQRLTTCHRIFHTARRWSGRRP